MDAQYIKTIFYNHGVADKDSIKTLFNVESKWAGKIINRLLFEGVELNGRRIFLFDRSGLRDKKLRMVTHVTMLEVFLAARFILLAVFIVLEPELVRVMSSLNITVFIPLIVIASAIFFVYPDMVFRKGKLEAIKRVLAYTGLLLPAFYTQYGPQRLVLSFSGSIFVMVQGLVLLVLYHYTKYICGLGKKNHLRLKLIYKGKSYFRVVKVKEYITADQLIEFVLKKFMKKDRVNAEYYVAKLFRNNTELILNRTSKLYEYEIKDLDMIEVVSLRQIDN